MKTPLDYSPAQQQKAILSGVAAAIGLLAGAAGDGISVSEWLGAAAMALSTYIGVFYLRNGTDPDPTTSTPEPLRETTWGANMARPYTVLPPENDHGAAVVEALLVVSVFVALFVLVAVL